MKPQNPHEVVLVSISYNCSYTIDEYEKLGHKRFQEYFPPEDEHPDENSSGTTPNKKPGACLMLLFCSNACNVSMLHREVSISFSSFFFAVEREFWYTTSTANQFSVQYANDVEGSACGEDFGPFRR